MSSEEFDMMDELYFVASYEELERALSWEEDKMISTLESLLSKEWIRVLHTPEEEVFGKADLRKQAKSYFYLVSKKGLMAHNSE